MGARLLWLAASAVFAVAVLYFGFNEAIIASVKSFGAADTILTRSILAAFTPMLIVVGVWSASR